MIIPVTAVMSIQHLDGTPRLSYVEPSGTLNGSAVKRLLRVAVLNALEVEQFLRAEVGTTGYIPHRFCQLAQQFDDPRSGI